MFECFANLGGVDGFFVKVYGLRWVVSKFEGFFCQQITGCNFFPKV
jgi:hypothetical protein